jgi:hypothetical protein
LEKKLLKVIVRRNGKIICKQLCFLRIFLNFASCSSDCPVDSLSEFGSKLKRGGVMADGREEREEQEKRRELEERENQEDRIDRYRRDEWEPERDES